MTKKAAVALALSMFARDASAGSCDYTFAAVPYTASSPGTHCLTTDVTYGSTTGNAITITVDGVILDLQGRQLSGSTNASTGAIGIRVLGKTRVTVRDGIVNGFQYGVVFDAPAHLVTVERVSVVESRLVGIYVGSGTANVVRDCLVSSVGGTSWSTPFSIGIWTVSTQTGVEHNRVIGTVPPASGGTAYGIVTGGLGAVSRNVVQGLYAGDVCYALGSEDVYRDNTARGCGTSYAGGVPGPANFP